MKCCYCGQELKEGYRFCNNCGAPVTPVNQSFGENWNQVHPENGSAGDDWNQANPENDSSWDNWSQDSANHSQLQENSSPSKKKSRKVLKYLGILAGVFLIGFIGLNVYVKVQEKNRAEELASQKEVLITELREEFTFPENDESNAITRVLQGEWWDAEDLNQNSEYPTSFTFQGSDGCTYHGGSIMTSNFSIGGNYVIDTESRKIYFIKETLQEKLDAIDEAEDLTEVEFDINFYIDNCVEDIIYEIDENGYLILYYEGSQLIKG